VDVDLRRRLLDDREPMLVVCERPVGVDPRLHADLGRAELDRLRDLLLERRAVVLVGVGRALALAETAERAADDADVGNVDVAADNERDGLSGQLGAQLVRRFAELLDHLRPRLGEQGRELVLAERDAGAAFRDRRRNDV
jgi:hypothetical protein